MSTNTILYAKGIAQSVIVGAITEKVIAQSLADYVKVGGGAAWIFAVDGVTEAPGQNILDELASAMRVAAMKAGLRLAIVVTTNPMVKLGARMIEMKARVPVQVASSMHEALALAKAAA